MEKNLNYYILTYKTYLENGDIQVAYEGLLKYLMHLKTHCEKVFGSEYSFGNVFHGYMDFSYFYFFNEFLRSEKLRFGIVLNHKIMRFELWLFGQNTEIQKKYWDLLKTSAWNKNQIAMPKYSVLEVVLIEDPDFDQLALLDTQIEKKVKFYLEEIVHYLEDLQK